MKRLLPYPLLTLSLIVLWLVLQQAVSLGHILVGTLIAVLASISMAALQPKRSRIRNIGAILTLAARVAVDIVTSNIAVASIILQGHRRASTAGFLTLPLALRNPSALAVLSCIITATPGSAWLEYDAARSTVLIHVLDLADAENWIATVKSRYEAPLLEIFQ